MKKLIALFVMALASAAALAANPTLGSHGMLLFGGADALYASHLPMFHPPHDYQVILRVRLADKAQDAALRARLDGKVALWTLDPEKFELDRLAPGAANPIARFKAKLVLGHFEQGGKTQYQNASVIVEQVLYFRQLSAKPARAATARYVQIGTGRNRYLVKEIDSRPDFDHVLAIRTDSGVPVTAIVLAKNALQEPDAAAIAKALPGIAVRGSVYFYTDDLR